MENKKRRIVGATAVSAAAMASMLGIAVPALADTAATTVGPPAQGAMLKVENAMLKLDGLFLKSTAVDNAFHKVQTIFFKFDGGNQTS